jgi:hypothetical protein
MWFGTEQIPPGGHIAKHKHLGQDEIILIQAGTARVLAGYDSGGIQAMSASRTR